MLSHQFNRAVHGSDNDKAELLDQMRKSFPESSLGWLKKNDIAVQRTTIEPSQLDWDNRHEWAATHEPKKVKATRKDIKDGKDKPVVTVDRPGHDNLFIMDGHHHAEAYTQLDRHDIPAFIVKVPRVNGPWDTQHDKQEHNKDA